MTTTETMAGNVLVELLKDAGSPQTVGEVRVAAIEAGLTVDLEIEGLKQKQQDTRLRALLRGAEGVDEVQIGKGAKRFQVGGAETATPKKKRSTKIVSDRWDNGLSPKVAATAEKWAAAFIERLGGKDHSGDGDNVDGPAIDPRGIVMEKVTPMELLTRWYAPNNKGYNERKLVKDLRAAFPAPVEVEDDASTERAA